MGRVRVTPLAQQDLEDIWYFIAQDDPAAADRMLTMLAEKLQLLADNPLLGPARSDIAAELRYHPVGSHLVLYRVISGGIEAVRIVHGARNLLDLIGENSP
jgi:toxin ParE1/3/4